MKYRTKTFQVRDKVEGAARNIEDNVWQWTNEEDKMLQIYKVKGHLSIERETTTEHVGRVTAYYDVDYHPKADLLPLPDPTLPVGMQTLFDDDYKIQRLITVLNIHSVFATGIIHYESIPANEVINFDPPLDFPQNEDIFGNLCSYALSIYPTWINAMTIFYFR